MKVFKEIPTPPYNPYGIRISRPEFANMTIDEIRVAAKIDTHYEAFGWQSGVFIRSTCTVHLFFKNSPFNPLIPKP